MIQQRNWKQREENTNWKEREENTNWVDKEKGYLRGSLRRERKQINEEEDIAYKGADLVQIFQDYDIKIF